MALKAACRGVRRSPFSDVRQGFAVRTDGLLTRVDKPALLRRLFELACYYSGQVLSYTCIDESAFGPTNGTSN